MQTWSFIALILCAVSSGRSDTNETYALQKLFSTPAPALRPNTAPPPASSISPMLLSLSSVPAVPIELSIQRYEAMNGSPLITVPEVPVEPAGAYGLLKRSVLDPITTPEVLKFKKVQLTGGIVGAIKKKNPFYLLNPLIFAIDW